MYERAEAGLPDLSVIELMQESKLCRKIACQKKDLNKTEAKDYNTINVKIRDLSREGFINSKTDATGRRKFLSLTPRGKVLIADGIVVSANSSNSSIPPVVPTDLKE